MSWRGVLTLLLMAGALVSGWAVWKHRSPETASVAQDGRPDYVLHDFEITTLDREGKESFTLRAPNLSRNRADDTMRMATPLFLLPNEDGKYWEVRSRTGWVSADHNEIRLQGEVKANSPEGALRPITMNTDRLNVFPQKQLARTDARVTIIRPDAMISGTGMIASSQFKNLQLQSQVKARVIAK